MCEFAHDAELAQRHRNVNAEPSLRSPPPPNYHQVAPAGTQLKRRRAWDLFLAVPSDSESAAAAVLVVNKRSTFTLEDAHVALAIMNDEAAARRLDVRQLLLTTRAGVAPSAEAFLKGAQASLAAASASVSSDASDGDGDGDGEAAGVIAVLRWEQAQQLAREGTLGRFLATAGSRRRDGSGVPTPPSFALPAWLREERERGVGATFDLHSPFEPAGDQPEAIGALARGLEEGKRHQTLLGATGTVRSVACIFIA